MGVALFPLTIQQLADLGKSGLKLSQLRGSQFYLPTGVRDLHEKPRWGRQHPFQLISSNGGALFAAALIAHAPWMGGRDLHFLPVLRHGAARNVDALILKHGGDLLDRKRTRL